MRRRAGSLSFGRLLLGVAVLALVAGGAPPLAGAASPAPPGSGPAATSSPPGRAAAEIPALEDGSWVRLDTPVRLHDSRSGAPLGPGSVERIEIGEALDAYEADPAGLVLSVTVTGGTRASDLAVWPSGPRPRTSNLNWRPGETVANQVVVPVVDSGFLVGNRAGAVHVIVDVMGHLGTTDGGGFGAPAPTRYTPVAPTRVLDTRAPGAPLDRFGPGEVGTLDLTGLASMPDDTDTAVTGVVVNLTAVGPSERTHLALGRGSGAQFLLRKTSNLNVEPGQTRAVLAHVPVGESGTIAIRNQSGTVDVIVDVLGWYSPTGSTLHTTGPVRLFDTRSPISPLTGPFVGGTPRTVDAGAIPDGATAAVVNLTVTGGTTAGDLRAWATGTPMPKVSNLNWPAGDTRPNLAIIPLDPQGRFQLRTSAGSTHVIADLVGWTAPPVPVLTPTITDLAVPEGARISGIDCTSATFCMAMATWHTTEAIVWDGTAWTSHPLPLWGGDPGPVVCGTPDDCLVGQMFFEDPYDGYSTMVIHRWDGTALTEIGSVPCCDRTDPALHWGCTSDGWCFTRSGEARTRRHQVHTCASDAFCIGTTDDEAPLDQRLKRLVPGPPTPMPVDTSLDGWFPLGAWCSSDTACTAVDTTGVAAWDGTSWARAARAPIADLDAWSRWPEEWFQGLPTKVDWSCADVDRCVHTFRLDNSAVVVLARDGDTWREIDLGVAPTYVNTYLVEPSCAPDGTCALLFDYPNRVIRFELPA